MKRILLIALLFSALVWVANASNKDGETRTATVSTKISANDLVNIQAKYTDLVVETWNKNEVEVVATIRYDGKMTDKIVQFLDAFQDHVESNIKYGGGELLIDTNLDEPNKFQIGSKKVGIIIGYSEDELKLDYKIKAPAKNKYVIKNSYRDVRLTGSFEEMDITQYSGDLIAEEIEQAELNLKYGSARFNRIGEANMEIYEQKLTIKVLGELDINAKYSKLEFDEVSEIEAMSYESDFKIGSITDLSGNFKYGEIEITGELQKAELEFYEMDVEANNIGTIRYKNSKYSTLEAQSVNTLIFDQSYEDETEIDVLGSFESVNSKYGKHRIGTLKQRIELNAYEDEISIERAESTATAITLAGKYIDATFGILEQSFNLSGNVKYGKIDYDKNAVDVRRYIKDGDQLEVEVLSKTKKENPLIIKVNGYEIDVTIE